MPSIQYDPTTVAAEPALTAPNARGANLTSAVGQSVEQLGERTAQFASSVERINYQQKEADEITSLKQNLMKGDEQFTQYMEQQKSEVAVNGAGYVDKFKTAFDPWAEQLQAGVTTPRAKRIAAESIASFHNRFYNQASAWQVNTNRAWRVSTFDDSITADAAAVQQDPAQYDSRLKGQLDSIDALSGELHPEDKISLRQRAQRSLAEGASLGFVDHAPQSAIGILTGEKPLPVDSVQAKIVAEAKAKGVDPATALAISQLESGQKPDAKNPSPGQTSAGLFGQIDDNFNYYSKGGDRKDVDTQVRAGVAQIADEKKALTQSLGREPTPYEQRLTHWWGVGGGPAIIKAPDGENFGQLIGKWEKNPTQVAHTLAINGLNGQTTVGDVKHLVQVNMDKALKANAGYANAPDPDSAPQTDHMPSFFQQLQPQQREAMLTHARTLDRRDESAERATVEGRFNDAAANWERGQGAKDPPSLGEWQHAFGPATGLQKFQAQNKLQEFGAQYAKVSTASPEQQQAIYAQTSGAGDALGLKLHDAMGEAINRVNAERAADPIGFDAVKGMKLVQPLDFSDPKFLTGPLAARFDQAAQVAQQYGTPYTPLSKDEATKLGAFVTNAAPDQVQQYLGSMRAAAGGNPAHYMAALGQIASGHPIIAHAGAIADQNPQAAALMIQGEQLLRPKGEKKEQTILMPKEGMFRQAWHDNGADAAYAGNQASADLAFDAARAYYVAKQDPAARQDKEIDSKLWQESMDAATGGVVQFGQGKTLPPYGMKKEDFPDAVHAVWPGVMQAAGLDASEHRAESYSLLPIGPGQYGVVSGTTSLRGADGQPVVFDLLQGRPVSAQAPDTGARKPVKVVTDALRKFGGKA